MSTPTDANDAKALLCDRAARVAEMASTDREASGHLARYWWFLSGERIFSASVLQLSDSTVATLLRNPHEDFEQKQCCCSLLM